MNDIVEQCLFPWQSNMERKHKLSVGGHSVRPNQWVRFICFPQISGIKNWVPIGSKNYQDEANLFSVSSVWSRP